MPHYKLTSPSGKSYHGITTGSVERRLRKHASDAKRGSQGSLHRAIRKYGLGAFKVEVLDKTCDRATLIRLEIEGIKRDNTFKPNGYNLTLGGDGASGRMLNAAARATLSSVRRADWEKAEYREKMLATVAELPSAREKARAEKSDEDLKMETARRSASGAALQARLRKEGRASTGEKHAAAIAAAKARRTPEQISQEKARRTQAAILRWEKRKATQC